MVSMRGVLLASFLSLACAAKFSVGAGVDSIMEQMSSLQLQGTTRGAGRAAGARTAVDALLKTIGKAQKLDDTARETLDTVSGLLQDILDQLGLDRDTEQPNLNAITQAVANCVVQTVVDSVNSKLGHSNAARTNHTDCREVEAVRYDEYDEACQSVIDTLSSLHNTDLDCIPAPLQADKTKGEQWLTWLTAIQTWFNNADAGLNGVDTVVKTCDDATALLDSKRTECNSEQQIFESVTCAYVEALSQRCINEGSCYSTETGNYADTVTRIFGEANTRVEDARMVTYVKCLVDFLRNPANDPTTMDALTAACDTAKNADYSSFNNTAVDVPVQPTCTTVNHCPSCGGWDAAEYGAIDAVKSAPQALAIECSLP